jgi:hypothetical protein
LHARYARPPAELPRWAFGLATGAALILVASRTIPTFVRRASMHQGVHQGDLAMASRLERLWQPGTIVHCDVTAVETLTGLPPSAFVRWQLPDTSARNLDLERVAGHEVFVVSTAPRVAHIRGHLREVYTAGDLRLYEYAPTTEPMAIDSPSRDTNSAGFTQPPASSPSE